MNTIQFNPTNKCIRQSQPPNSSTRRKHYNILAYTRVPHSQGDHTTGHYTKIGPRRLLGTKQIRTHKGQSYWHGSHKLGRPTNSTKPMRTVDPTLDRCVPKAGDKPSSSPLSTTGVTLVRNSHLLLCGLLVAWLWTAQNSPTIGAFIRADGLALAGKACTSLPKIPVAKHTTSADNIMSQANITSQANVTSQANLTPKDQTYTGS